jgi:hypothetical protein
MGGCANQEIKKHDNSACIKNKKEPLPAFFHKMQKR